MSASMVVCGNPLLPPMRGVPAPIGRELRDLAPAVDGPLMLRLNGAWVMRATWSRPVFDGDIIEWHVIPLGGGNGNGSRTLLQAIIVVVALVADYYFPEFSGQINAAATAALALTNALIPLKKNTPTIGTTSPESVYNVTTAANQARLAQPIPVIYGRMLTFPDYAGQPYSEYDNQNDQYFYAVYCIGQGNYNVERLQIDDTSLDHYSDVHYEILPPGSLPTVALANVVTAQEVSGQTMDSGRPIGAFAATGPATPVAYIGVDVVFPKGLGLSDTSGNIGPLSATYRVDCRYIDDFGIAAGDWFALGITTVTRATNTVQRISNKWQLPSVGRVEVRIVRTDTKNTSDYALHDLSWAGLRAYLSTAAPLCPTATHMAIRIRASQQLSGLSQRRISGIWKRKVRTWAAGVWSAEVETRNPMWARLDKLTNAVYGDGLADSRIDLQGHADLAAVYDARQDHFDILFDAKVSSIDADRTICLAGRAMPFQRGGVCTVVRDQLQTLPVTAYTSRDIVPGSMTMDYALATEVTADAVIVEYFNYITWDWREIQCNAPGVTTPVNAVRQRMLGITGPTQAQREGLYTAAQNVYRRKFPKWTTEMLGLIPAYGSAVMFAPALPGWGQAGDVAFWDLPTLTMGLTEPATFTAGAQHYISIRRDDGSVTQAIAVIAGPTAYDLVLASAPMEANGITPIAFRLDDGGRERPKYVFGAGSQSRMMVRLLGVSKKGRGQGGAPLVELSSVAEDVRIHAVDNALLPGPGQIQDPISIATGGTATVFQTTINLNATTNAGGTSVVGITLSGVNADWVLSLDMPAGGLFTAWSPWSSDYSSEVPFPPTAWGNNFQVTNSDGSVASFGSVAIATTDVAAQAAFAPVNITGYVSYTFWINDTNPGDNRGGLSIRVTKIN